MTRRGLGLAHVPTPVEAMDRLAAALDMAEGALLVKRDDMTGLAGGGNKARKLEHLCADALAQGCDTLVTGGGRQSNHVRMTAAAANRLGLACTIVLSSGTPDLPSGNVILDLLLGPEIVWAGPVGYSGTEEAIAATCERLRAEGRTPYPMPIGGATPVGALGYVDAADELRAQVPDVALVVTADGSGGTHAGLVAGLGDAGMVLGVDVGARGDLDDYVPATAAKTAALAGRPEPAGDVTVDHDHAGPDYAVPTEETWAAIELAARTEGLVLDPVYTGKALAGLVTARRTGRIGRHDRVVFLHTGGTPALFTAATSRALAERYGPGDCR